MGLAFHYPGPMAFTKYSSHLKESYYVLSREGAKYTESDKVVRLLAGMHGDLSTSVLDAMSKCHIRYRDNFDLAVMHIKAALAHQTLQLHHATPCGQDVRARNNNDMNVAPEPHSRVERRPHRHNSKLPDTGPSYPTFGGERCEHVYGPGALNRPAVSRPSHQHNPWTRERWHTAFNPLVEQHMRNIGGRCNQPNFRGGRGNWNVARGHGPKSYGRPHRTGYY